MSRCTHNTPTRDENAPGKGLIYRIFGEGESVLWWGLPIGSLAGVRLRLHLIYPTFVLAQLGYAVWMGQGPSFVALGAAGLLLSVIVHELGRWVAYRVLAGRSEAHESGPFAGEGSTCRGEVCFWPMGGMWRLDCFSISSVDGCAACGAWLASVVQIVVLGAIVWRVTGDSNAVLFDLFAPDTVLGSFSTQSTLSTLGLIALWQAYAMGVYLAGLNLLPILPLDGGMVLRWMLGRGRSLQATDIVSAQAGLMLAMVVFVLAMVSQLTIVAGLAVCLGLVCWSELQSARFSLDPAGLDRWQALLDGRTPQAGLEEHAIGPQTNPVRSQLSDADRASIEAVLAKISEQGMESLSRGERRVLKRATNRLRDD